MVNPDEQAELDLDVELDWGPQSAGEPRHAARPRSGVDDLGGAYDVGEPDDDYDDADGSGELLPAVPLLPTIAGRVDAISGLLRSITMRLDGLNAATDVYRSSVTDRIDEYTETVIQVSRQTDQTLEEYRRANERAIGELRRNAADRAETLNRLIGRVEELTTDVASLVGGGGGAAEVVLDPVLERQQATDKLLGEVRTLVEAVVDTMPGSAEGSGADVQGALEELQTEVQELKSRLPTKGPRVLLTRADLDNAVDLIADAVVKRIDVGAIVDAVVEQLQASFEVVTEPVAPELPPLEPPRLPDPSRGGRLRRGGR